VGIAYANEPRKEATMSNGHVESIAKFAQNAEKMKSEHTKSRVTFCYLLAEATGTLAKLR
jgi:hypothetical protein